MGYAKYLFRSSDRWLDNKLNEEEIEEHRRKLRKIYPQIEGDDPDWILHYGRKKHKWWWLLR